MPQEVYSIELSDLAGLPYLVMNIGTNYCKSDVTMIVVDLSDTKTYQSIVDAC